METEKTRDKKILFWQGFSLQQPGGGVTILKKLMSFSKNYGYNYFVCFDENEVPTEFKKVASENEELALRSRARTTFSSRLNPIITLLIILGVDIKAKRSFTTLLNQIKPDVIHLTAHGLSFPLFCRIAKKWGRAKLAISVHDLWMSTLYTKLPPNWILNYIFKKCLLAAEVCYVVSPEMGEYLKVNFGVKKYIVVHDGYIQSDIHFPKASIKKRSHFLYVGLITQLQLELMYVLMDAMAELKDTQFSIGICSNNYLYKKAHHTNIEVNNYGWVDESRLQTISREYAFGLLPLGFDESVKLSYKICLMTKIPFYMHTGLPVFCIGEESTAAIKLLKREKVGIFCTENSQESILKSLEYALKLVDKEYDKLLDNAKISVQTTFNAALISDRFYKSLL